MYLHTDDSSSFAVSHFLIITAWNLSVKGQYLSLPQTHMCLSTHTHWPIHTNENENRNTPSQAYMLEMKMLIGRRYKILYATLIPLELSFHPNVIQYLFNYGSLEGDGPPLPSLHAHFNVWEDDISAGPCALCSVEE